MRAEVFHATVRALRLIVRPGESAIKSFPLVRAGSLVPFVKWLRAEERPIENRLRITRLAHVAWDHPEQPIPLISALNFLAEISAREGFADLGCRVVSDESINDIGVLGKAALEGPTVREGVMRVCQTMHSYCTHERMVFQKKPGGGRLLVSFDVSMKPDALHIALQYTAALVRLFCLGAGGADPVFERLRIPPHPHCGIDHLRPWFGDGVKVATGRTMAIDFSAAVLDLSIRAPAAMPAPPKEDNRPPLSDENGIEPMMRYLVGTMLDDCVPTARELAICSGMSLRSLQRSLALAGTSFSAVLYASHRDRALACLASNDCALDELGYSHTACLTRATRRWTGCTPGEVRRLSSSKK